MALADDLGVAFQLTNILRDVREDLTAGRLYLPREDLSSFDCGSRTAESRGTSPGLPGSRQHGRGMVRPRARSRAPPRRPSASCVTAMAGIYRRLLRRIERQPELVLTGRLSLPGWRRAGWPRAASWGWRVRTVVVVGGGLAGITAPSSAPMQVRR